MYTLEGHAAYPALWRGRLPNTLAATIRFFRRALRSGECIVFLRYGKVVTSLLLKSVILDLLLYSSVPPAGRWNSLLWNAPAL